MKLKTLAAALVSALCVASTPLAAASYVIDTKGQHAAINFRIKHLGYSWLSGRFDKFDGTFEYDPKKPEASTVDVTVDTASLNTNHAERDKHVRSPDFLNVEKFPRATFKSKKVTSKGDGKAEIVGDFTLNGVTKSITIAAHYIGGGRDPWGGTRAGFTGTTSIALKDFNIKTDLGPASQTVDLILDVEGILK